jgi:hypothetical protein
MKAAPLQWGVPEGGLSTGQTTYFNFGFTKIFVQGFPCR